MQLVADRMGVTESYARTYLDRMPEGERFALLDAELRAIAAVADVEAVSDLHDIDIADAAEADDPRAALKEIIMDSSDRKLRAKLAAHSRWANTPEDERREQSRRAREAFDARFEREVDPDGTLPPAERARRAEHARKAYFYRLALKSAKARRERKGRN